MTPVTVRSNERQPRRWLWVFGEIDGLRWVLDHRQMAFRTHQARRAGRIRERDTAVLYVTRGAFHNPTRDRARLAGLAEVIGPPEQGQSVEIIDREFQLLVPIQVTILLPEREGPEVAPVAGRLDRVKRPEVWGHYFRNSPIEMTEHDWTLLRGLIEEWRTEQ